MNPKLLKTLPPKKDLQRVFEDSSKKEGLKQQKGKNYMSNIIMPIELAQIPNVLLATSSSNHQLIIHEHLFILLCNFQVHQGEFQIRRIVLVDEVLQSISKRAAHNESDDLL